MYPASNSCHFFYSFRGAFGESLYQRLDAVLREPLDYDNSEIQKLKNDVGAYQGEDAKALQDLLARVLDIRSVR